MFINYINDSDLRGVLEQHNIMVFVGNGFDIAVLNKYRKDNLVSSYSKFYDYLCYKGISSNNILYKKMTSDKEKKRENWSDFEETIGALLQENVSSLTLEKSLKEIQKYFLLFLNELVEPEILLRESEDAEANQWGIESLSKFLADLEEEDYKKIKFPKLTGHYHMYNFLFVNFNYTSLLDNYIYLDKEQFEPHPYKTVGTNFSFHPNPNRYNEDKRHSETIWSSFVIANIIHPHGYQDIPRSLLFGIEEDAYREKKEYNKFNKSYWAQNNQKYKTYFENVRLFIIYGTSIGQTDSWWWRKVLNSLLETESELIIYYYSRKQESKEAIKKKFIDACKQNELKAEEIEKVNNKIYVIRYTDINDNVLFGLKERPKQ